MSVKNNEAELDSLTKLERIVERTFDPDYFDDLLNLATEVCLRESPDYDMAKDTQHDSPELELIKVLGVRGIAHALDVLAGHVPADSCPDSEEPEGERVYGDTVLRCPDLFSREIDLSRVEKARTFGQQLLEESYECLGEDVDSYLRKFNDAQTDEEQIAVLEWLSKRVQDMTGSDLLLEVEDGEKRSGWLYHPLRLSPKALGVYPNHSFEPTCLSKSVLTASFLNRTEAPYLHAGVMKTENVAEVQELGLSCMIASEHPSLAHNPYLKNRLEGVGVSMYRGLGLEGDGFHAAVATRLKSGNWFVLDPNYDLMYVASPDMSTSLQAAHDDIESLGQVAPGLERVVKNRRLSDVFAAVFPITRVENIELDDDKAEELIDGGPAEIGAWLRDVTEDIFNDLRNRGNQNDSLAAESVNHVSRTEVVVNQVASMSLLESSIMEAIHGYYLWDKSPSVVERHCQKDPAYRQRRKEDLACLPFMVFLEASQSFADMSSSNTEHYSFEVGDPAHRIGMAVLSDFASYLDSNISPGFMSTNWPSRIPITEFEAEESTAPASHALQWNLMGWLRRTGLTYYGQDGFIEKQLLDQIKEEKDGRN